MPRIKALIVDTPPQLPDDINARMFVIEYEDGTTRRLGMVATDLHLLAGELARTELKDLPLRLEAARTAPEDIADGPSIAEPRRRKR